MDKDTLKKEIRDFIVDTFLFCDGSDSFTDSDSFMQSGIVDSTGIFGIWGKPILTCAIMNRLLLL